MHSLELQSHFAVLGTAKNAIKSVLHMAQCYNPTMLFSMDKIFPQCLLALNPVLQMLHEILTSSFFLTISLSIIASRSVACYFLLSLWIDPRVPLSQV